MGSPSWPRVSGVSSSPCFDLGAKASVVFPLSLGRNFLSLCLMPLSRALPFLLQLLVRSAEGCPRFRPGMRFRPVDFFSPVWSRLKQRNYPCPRFPLENGGFPSRDRFYPEHSRSSTRSLSGCLSSGGFSVRGLSCNG